MEERKQQKEEEEEIMERKQPKEEEIMERKHKIAGGDSSELAEDYQIRKRTEFEDRIRSSFRSKGMWIDYANWEMKNKLYDRARSVFGRAISSLPTEDELWYKYIHMEEMLGNAAVARKIFESWTTTETWKMVGEQVWLSFIKFELRNKEIDRARAIFERFVQYYRHPQRAKPWIRYAKFEMKNGGIFRARNVYVRAIQSYSKNDDDDDDYEQAQLLFAAFTEFEAERARCVHKMALDQWPVAHFLSNKFVSLKKQYGKGDDRETTIEDDVIVRNRGKNPQYYEDEVRKNPRNYDLWLDYIKLLQQEEETKGKDDTRIREVYKRAISNVPPAPEKRYWKRYIYLWINYALYEELGTGDSELAPHVYRDCLELIPHDEFSFAKIWLLAAQCEMRQLNLKGARQILDSAIGKAPNAKIFNNYIEMELQIGNRNRCRKLYDKYIGWSPQNCQVWIKYAEFEDSLFETERVRSLFEMAVGQPELDRPDLLWKAYIEFEHSQDEFERTRQLYERLLHKTKHLKVWISYAKFEAQAHGDGSNLDSARRVFERAFDYFTTSAASEFKEETCMLLEEWSNMEASFGDLGDASLVQSRLPKTVKRRRSIVTQDGSPEEEYLFPAEYETPKKQKK